MTVPNRDAEKVVAVLEPGQLVCNTTRPLPRAELSKALRVGLWTLRVFSLVLAGMVLCSFVLQL